MYGVVVAYTAIASGMALYAVAATFGWLATIALIAGGLLCLGLLYLEDISQ